MARGVRGRPRGSKNKKKYKANVFKSLLPKSMIPHYHVRRVSATQELADSIDLNVPDSNLYKAFETNLNMLNNVSELVALYDCYRITAVKYQMLWTLGASNVNLSSIYTPVLTYFWDHDDNTTPADGEFRDRASAKAIKLTAGKIYSICDRKPAVASAIFNSPISTGYSVRTSPKMDMASPAVPHYGLKINVNKAGLSMGTLQIRRTLYVTCYSAR